MSGARKILKKQPLLLPVPGQELWAISRRQKHAEDRYCLTRWEPFYLIKRLSDPVAGAVAFEDNADAYTAAALADRQADEWNAVQEDWVNEARNAAVFYEDNYANVGKQ